MFMYMKKIYIYEKNKQTILQILQKNENENPVVNNKVEKCRQTPKRRGKDPKSPGTVGKRRKVVSKSPGAHNQLYQESQGNTDSHKKVSILSV